MSEDALIRLDNLLLLRKERKLNAEALATLTGKTASYYRQLLAGKKSFGEKIARDLEKAMALPHGWLDQPREVEELPNVMAEPIKMRGAHDLGQRALTTAQNELSYENEIDHNQLSPLAKTLGRALDSISDDEKKIDAFLAALRQLERGQ
jgi:transcriptional regulator with XRE-family HTH domain